MTRIREEEESIFGRMHPSSCDTKDIYHNMCMPHLVKIGQFLRNLAERDFRDLFWPYVTLNFDLLTPKVERFMPLTHASSVPICIRINSLVFKTSCSHCSQVW